MLQPTSRWTGLAAQPQSRAAPQTSVPLGAQVDSAGRNPAMALNELCQAGILQATGYEVLDQTGPSHQPTFSVVAWATTPEGTTFRTDPIQPPSKKSGQRLAADQLFDLLVAAVYRAGEYSGAWDTLPACRWV